MTITIRHAAPSDLASIQAISDAAYGVYVAAMGQKPGPMLADYGAHLADDAVLVAADSRAPCSPISSGGSACPRRSVRGYAAGFWLENIAVDPAAGRHCASACLQTRLVSAGCKVAGAGHIPKGTIMIDVIIALEAELAGRRLPPGFRVTFCGVGKINAALATAAVLARPDCARVVNFGTAGSLRPELAGQLLRVNRMLQRDMDKQC